ncbi:DUF4315 family protein [Paenibacillus sp. p3-SID1389]|uniref:DUF4315 family protein n=1 Tax=Paenibacillus sp. p3-SID1389 TaxID=2916364 RepID=UPI0021A269EE|nr:DUF4315 family protein [Paenibacillus sp. p3-SID1389]MCT2195203.1 DUF4315 family protein [Paenibacillus sp. p3-SID1389]
MRNRFLVGALSGLLVGAIIFGGSSAIAAVKSLVGSKVTGVYTINKADGTKVADGAVINGAAYVPVRDVSEAVGIPLRVEGKTITIGTIKESEVIGANDAMSPEVMELANAISRYERDILSWKGLIETENATLTSLNESRAAAEKGAAEAPFLVEGIDANIEKTKARIAEYQAKIDAANAEIAELQAKIDANK